MALAQFPLQTNNCRRTLLRLIKVSGRGTELLLGMLWAIWWPGNCKQNRSFTLNDGGIVLLPLLSCTIRAVAGQVNGRLHERAVEAFALLDASSNPAIDIT